jgi:2-oxo-4-hydroxy-4-carboxy--5-ureidoimidazoline (OHCU) decarboxylase
MCIYSYNFGGCGCSSDKDTPNSKISQPSQAISKKTQETIKISQKAREAIETAKSFNAISDQVNYLVEQAQKFYDSEQFTEVIDIAEYILQYLDKNSQEAKNLLMEAHKALASVEAVAEDLKGIFGSFE